MGVRRQGESCANLEDKPVVFLFVTDLHASSRHFVQEQHAIRSVPDILSSSNLVENPLKILLEVRTIEDFPRVTEQVPDGSALQCPIEQLDSKFLPVAGYVPEIDVCFP